MPLSLQSKLLRVLQDFSIRRVGGEVEIDVDVRVIAASNRDLEAESKENLFRRDLFYRLSVVTLTVPPLRERRDDIPVLIEKIMERLAPKIGIDIHDISDEALEKLCRYDWPGNVRELSNVIERALLLCEGDILTAADLPVGIAEIDSRPGSLDVSLCEIPDAWIDKTLPEVTRLAIDNIERAYLEMVLTETRGGLLRRPACFSGTQRAGIHQRGLYNKMKRLNLSKRDFR